MTLKSLHRIASHEPKATCIKIGGVLSRYVNTSRVCLAASGGQISIKLDRLSDLVDVIDRLKVLHIQINGFHIS